MAGLGDLLRRGDAHDAVVVGLAVLAVPELIAVGHDRHVVEVVGRGRRGRHPLERPRVPRVGARRDPARLRSDEPTSELQSLMRISYAVFCLKPNKATQTTQT